MQNSKFSELHAVADNLMRLNLFGLGWNFGPMIRDQECNPLALTDEGWSNASPDGETGKGRSGKEWLPNHLIWEILNRDSPEFAVKRIRDTEVDVDLYLWRSALWPVELKLISPREHYSRQEI